MLEVLNKMLDRAEAAQRSTDFKAGALAFLNAFVCIGLLNVLNPLNTALIQIFPALHWIIGILLLGLVLCLVSFSVQFADSWIPILPTQLNLNNPAHAGTVSSREYLVNLYRNVANQELAPKDAPKNELDLADQIVMTSRKTALKTTFFTVALCCDLFGLVLVPLLFVLKGS